MPAPLISLLSPLVQCGRTQRPVPWTRSRGTARATTFTATLFGLLLAGGLLSEVVHIPQDRGPIYTVAQVQLRLARQPRSWTNRTLLLRGVAVSLDCWVQTADALALCASHRMFLEDDNSAAEVAPIPLVSAGPDALLALERRVPLLGSLAPSPQMIRWNAVATYRVRLRAASDEVCGAVTCYQAVVLDTLPS